MSQESDQLSSGLAASLHTTNDACEVALTIQSWMHPTSNMPAISSVTEEHACWKHGMVDSRLTTPR